MLWVAKGTSIMQYAVKRFAESKENGLCLVDMPTGTGKTYQTRLFIEKFIRGEFLQETELLIYATPLKKNIDDIYNDLQKSFEDDPELFEKNVLRLYSNYECVLEKFSDVENKIQSSLKKRDSFKQLRNKILAYKQLESAGGFSKELLSTTLKEIRTVYCWSSTSIAPTVMVPPRLQRSASVSNSSSESVRFSNSQILVGMPMAR